MSKERVVMLGMAVLWSVGFIASGIAATTPGVLLVPAVIVVCAVVNDWREDR